MTNWSPAEERNFQQLIKQAEEQSRAYYKLADNEQPPQPVAVQMPDHSITLLQPIQASPQPAPPVQRRYKVHRRSALPFNIDGETALLLALLWLLWQEEADIQVILAIAYILLV